MNGREIKFRVWDGERMIPAGKPWSYCYVDQDGALWRGQQGGIEYQQGEVMQYTGLTDVEATEIYEGDVVEHYDWRDGSRVVSVVKWSDRSAWWSLYDGEDFTEGLSRAEQPRVIGNIFEDPELLEEEA